MSATETSLPFRFLHTRDATVISWMAYLPNKVTVEQAFLDPKALYQVPPERCLNCNFGKDLERILAHVAILFFAPKVST